MELKDLVQIAVTKTIQNFQETDLYCEVMDSVDVEVEKGNFYLTHYFKEQYAPKEITNLVTTLRYLGFKANVSNDFSHVKVFWDFLHENK